MKSDRKTTMNPTLQQQAADETTPPNRLKELAFLSTELARLVANNSSTPSELLEELANSSDATTRKHTAVNPNTPAEVLIELGAEFPDQVVENPVFSLLLLEDPNLFNQIPLTTLRGILKHEDAPVYFLERVADKQDLEVQLALVMNAKTPKHILEKLTQSKNSQVAEAAELHCNWVGEITEGWDEIARQAIKKSSLPHQQDNEAKLAAIGAIPEFLLPALLEDVRCSLAVHSENPSVLEQLVADESPKTRLLVAQNPSTPVTALEQLPQNQRDHILARHPKTPIRILEQLVKVREACDISASRLFQYVAQDFINRKHILDRLLQILPEQDILVRKTIAENLNTPLYILENLVNDQYEVLTALVTNPNMPIEMVKQIVWNRLINFIPRNLVDVYYDCFLAKRSDTSANIMEQLAAHQNRNVRRCVAENPNTPINLLAQLARDEEFEVRRAVAYNINTPENILGELAQDQSASIQQAISERLTYTQRKREIYLPDAQSLTQRERECLETLIRYGLSIGHLVARELTTPKRILDYLARNNVLQAVAINPNTSVETLERLAQEDYAEVREAAIKNLAMRNPDNLPTVLESFAQSSQPSFNRLIVFFHPQAPAPLLAKNSRSLSWLERYAIATNRNTPVAICQRLIQDGNRVVRAAAKANLKERSQQL